MKENKEELERELD